MGSQQLPSTVGSTQQAFNKESNFYYQMSRLRNSKLDLVRRAESYLSEQAQADGRFLKMEESFKPGATGFLCRQLGDTERQQGVSSLDIFIKDAPQAEGNSHLVLGHKEGHYYLVLHLADLFFSLPVLSQAQSPLPASCFLSSIYLIFYQDTLPSSTCVQTP